MAITLGRDRRAAFETLSLEMYNSPARRAQRAGLTASLPDRIAFLQRLIAAIEAGQGFRAFLTQEYEIAELSLQRREWRGLVLDGRPFDPMFIAEMYDLVGRQGYSFAQACAEFPRMFGRQTVKILDICERTGEFGGRYDERTGRYEPSALMVHLSFLERLLHLRRTLAQKLIMPALTTLVALGVILLFIWRVIPVIGELLTSLNVSLNPMTASLLWTGRFLEAYGWLAALTAVGGGVGYALARRRSPSLLRWENQVLLRIPILNRYFTQLAAYEWLGAFVSMVAVGELRAGLYEAGESVSQIYFRERFLAMADALTGGSYATPAESLAAATPFYVATTSMYRALASYAATGALSGLEDYRRDLERRMDDTLRKFTELLTPIITIALGILVGYVILALYVPLIQLVGALAK